MTHEFKLFDLYSSECTGKFESKLISPILSQQQLNLIITLKYLVEESIFYKDNKINQQSLTNIQILFFYKLQPISKMKIKIKTDFMLSFILTHSSSKCIRQTNCHSIMNAFHSVHLYGRKYYTLKNHLKNKHGTKFLQINICIS